MTPLWDPKLPQNGLQNCSKSGPKNDPKNDSENNQKWTSFGPQNGPQNPSKSVGPRTVKSCRRFPEGSWSQEAPRMPQDGPEEAKIAPSWPKMGPKIASRWGKLGQDCPRLLQNCSKKAPKTVKMDKDVAFALPLRFLCFSFAAEWGVFPKL